MFRRILAACGLALVGALLTVSAAPAGAIDNSLTGDGSGSLTTSAAPSPRATYVYVILAHNCPAFNKASIRVRQRENGTSGTNYFRQIAQGQVFRNGAWRNRGNQAVQRSTQFANNATELRLQRPELGLHLERGVLVLAPDPGPAAVVEQRRHAELLR